MASEDPYYTRKRVPDGVVAAVGETGLTPQEEHEARERKYSSNGVDVRKWGKSSTGGWKPQSDPYYGRKPVPDALISGVGETGLSPEEEYLNRERKYSASGIDVRKFSNSSTGFIHPTADPYYGRKPVSKTQTVGIGDTQMTPAEEFEVRERKQSLFQVSGDPFAAVAGKHRGSVSGLASGAANDAFERRRSSAVAPNLMGGTSTGGGYGSNTTHSGYTGTGTNKFPGQNYSGFDRNDQVSEKPQLPPVNVGDNTHHQPQVNTSNNVTTTTSTTVTSGYAPGASTTNTYHDKVTDYNDPNSIGPDEVR